MLNLSAMSSKDSLLKLISLKETVLPDWCPLVDGKLYVLRLYNSCKVELNYVVIRNTIKGSILDLKRKYNVGEIRNCDVMGRFSLAQLEEKRIDAWQHSFRKVRKE